MVEKSLEKEVTFGLEPEWWQGKEVGEEDPRWEEEQVHRLWTGNELASPKNVKKVIVDGASDGVEAVSV